MVNTKFNALVHYVIDKCDDPKRLGAIRLNKILLLSDTYAFKAYGQSITGEQYVKREKGPVPKTILATLRALEANQAIHVRDREYPTYRMREFVALTTAGTELFSDTEIKIVDDVIENVCNNYTANEISDSTHDIVWKAASMGEIIPMTATLVAIEGEPSNEAYEWADTVVAEVEAKKAAGTA